MCSPEIAKLYNPLITSFRCKGPGYSDRRQTNSHSPPPQKAVFISLFAFFVPLFALFFKNITFYFPFVI